MFIHGGQEETVTCILGTPEASATLRNPYHSITHSNTEINLNYV
jgi:hypothetical protein